MAATRCTKPPIVYHAVKVLASARPPAFPGIIARKGWVSRFSFSSPIRRRDFGGARPPKEKEAITVPALVFPSNVPPQVFLEAGARKSAALSWVAPFIIAKRLGASVRLSLGSSLVPVSCIEFGKMSDIMNEP